MGREDRWDQWEAWWGERFEALIAAVREGQQAATPRPLADWPLAQADLPAAGEYPDNMQGTAPEGTDGYLLVNPTGSTIGVWLYAGTPSEGLGRIALIAPPGSMRSIPYGGRGWRVDGALTAPGTGGAPVARLLAIHGPVQTGDGSDTMALTGSLPAGSSKIGLVGIEANGNEAYVFGSLGVGNNDGNALGNEASLGAWAGLMAFNDSSSAGWDRVRNNSQGTLLASAARTATATSPTMTNYNAKGVRITLNVTAASGTGGLTLVVFAVDSVSGNGKTINASPSAVTATGTTTYVIYPSALASADTQTTEAPLSRSWYAEIAAGDSSSYTYSLGYALIN